MRLRLGIVLLASLLLAGCSPASRARPDAPRGTAELKATRTDRDAGLVGIAPAFDPRRYRVLAVERFVVADPELEGDEARRIAASVPDFFQTELVRRLADTRLFDRVVNLSETGPPRTRGALRLEGTITRLTPSSRAFRSVGLGVGQSIAEIETRFVDAESGRPVVVTADRQVASRVRRDGEAHMRESFSEMARDLERLVVRLFRGDFRP